MSRYPYKYEKVGGGVRIHTSPEIASQLLGIAKKLFGNDILNGIIFTGHWYVQIRRKNHDESMADAQKVTKVWRDKQRVAPNRKGRGYS